MNIFYLHPNPKKAARYQCDKHVIKMILESVQMLYSAHHMMGSSVETAPPAVSTGKPGYRLVHKNHPCTIWARKTAANYIWLCRLAEALAEEYHYRYPKIQKGLAKVEHACEVHIRWLITNIPPALTTWLNLPDPEALVCHTHLTRPALAMPDEYKVPYDAIRSYRAFYCGSKGERGLLTYTRRRAPHWLFKRSAGPITQKQEKLATLKKQPTLNPLSAKKQPTQLKNMEEERFQPLIPTEIVSPAYSYQILPENTEAIDINDDTLRAVANSKN